MPIHDTLQDVVCHLSAQSASLPSPEDLQNYRKLQMGQMLNKTEQLDVSHKHRAQVKENTLLGKARYTLTSHPTTPSARTSCDKGNSIEDGAVNERLKTQSSIDIGSVSASKTKFQMVSNTGDLSGSIEATQLMPTPSFTRPCYVAEQREDRDQRRLFIVNTSVLAGVLGLFVSLLPLLAYPGPIEREIMGVSPVFSASQTNALISVSSQILTILPQFMIDMLIMTRPASAENVVQSITTCIGIRATMDSLNPFKFIRQKWYPRLSERTSVLLFFMLIGRLVIPILIGASVSMLKCLPPPLHLQDQNALLTPSH
jgi:hypothetical protein